MINSISKLREHNFKYIKEFMLGCTVEEKIDAHYVTVLVESPTQLKFFKANGKEIDRVDLILNSMWSTFFLDWNYLLISSHGWFETHKGVMVSLFYFPTERPILTEYERGLRYVVDRVTLDGRDVAGGLDGLSFPKDYTVKYKTTLPKVNMDMVHEIYDRNISNMVSGAVDFRVIMRELIGEGGRLAKGTPEGYIYKYKNKIYQDVLEDLDRTVDKGYNPQSRRVDTERTSYEYLLSIFLRYCKTNDYTDKFSRSYTKSICNIFNDFIINYERKDGVLAKNIDKESIECPHLGTKFDICYEYIPNPITKSICRENDFHKNIFKVLLANLRKGKEYKHCIYLSKGEVDQWNEIVKAIRIRVATD